MTPKEQRLKQIYEDYGQPWPTDLAKHLAAAEKAAPHPEMYDPDPTVQNLCWEDGHYDYYNELSMVPRMATILGYIYRLPIHRILDVGCGDGLITGNLRPYMDYRGIDVSPTAIERAADVRCIVADWHTHTTNIPYQCVLWAGMGPWLLGEMPQVLAKLQKWLVPDGYVILESMTDWISPICDWLKDWRYIAGVDLVYCDHDNLHRSIRVYRKA